MKCLQINKHRYGFTILFTRNIFFDMDINEWNFIPSIEFYRKPGVTNMLVFAFLCFALTIHKWKFNDAKE